MKKLLGMILFMSSLSVFAQNTAKINEELNKNNLVGAQEIAKAVAYENEKALSDYLAILNLNDAEPDVFVENLQKMREISSNAENYYHIYWYDIFKIPAGGFSKSQIKELNYIIGKSNFSGSLKAKANERLSRNGRLINRISDRNLYLAKLGTLNDWSITGCFENVSASGFNNDFAPIKNWKKSDKFKNKKGKEVYWFAMNKELKGSWVGLQQHLDVDDGIGFAQTFIELDQDIEAEIRFGNTGSFKLWVNDGLVAQMKEETNTYTDIFKSKVKLKKGWNRILFQLGSSELGAQELLVRLTDDNGNTLEVADSKPFNETYNTGQSQTENLGYADHIAFFVDAQQKNSSSLIDYLAAIRAYEVSNQKKKLRKLLEEAYQKYPNSTAINTAMLRLYSDLEFWSLHSGKIEEIKKKDPNSVLSIAVQYEDAMGSEKYDEAEELLEKLQDKLGDTRFIIKQQIDLELKNENQSNAIELIEKGYSMYPNSYDMVNLKYVVEMNVNKNPGSALKVLRKYLAKNYNSRAEKALGNHYFRHNNALEGLRLFEKMKRESPDAFEPILTLAKIYYSGQQYSQSVQYYNELIKHAPFIGNYYNQRGDCYSELGQENAAIKNYKKAIVYAPTLFDTRNKLRKLTGLKSISDDFEEPDYYAVAKEEVKKEDYPEDNSVILLEERQIVLYEGGGREETNYQVVAVMNNAGIDMWKEHYIPSSRSEDLIVEKAEVIKANGDITKAETNYNQIVFTGLEPGDKIVLVYKLKSYYDGILSEHYWDKQYLEYFVPLKKGVYSIIYHNSFDLKYQLENLELEPVVTENDDYKTLSWTVTDVPSIEDEAYMPNLCDAGSTLHLSTIPSWEYVVDWYDNLSRTKAKSDYEVKQVVAELFEGKDNLSDLEKAEIIYEYIVNNIRYSSVSFRQSGWIPQKASGVINSKIGDCKDVSTLFVVMCKEVGLDANLVLVDTKDKGRRKMTLPSVDFNHCIAKLNLPNESYYVELTSDLLPFSTVSGRLKNAFSLNIAPESSDKPEYINSPNRKKNGRERKTQVTLSPTTVNVKANNIKTGAYAADMRSTYRDLGEEARFKEMASALSFDFSTIKINELKFDETLENRNDSIHYFYDFTVNTPYTKIGDLKILRVPMISKMNPVDFLSLEERKFDIEMWRYIDFDFNNEEITITIPSNMRVVDLPSNFNLSTDFAEYSLKFKQTGNTLVIDRKFELKTDIVKQENYSEFRNFMNKIVEMENLNIGLKSR